jgi:4-hydroxybutyrate dehydrogenase
MNIITYLTTIHFGAGALASLADAMRDLNMARPLIVSDRGIAASGLIDKLTALLPANPALFLDVPTNPTESAVKEALQLYREAECDGVIAFGGGSPIDLAKGVALLATHDGELEHYAAILGGIPRITPAVAPLIAIPTTAGTGSEVGRAALITLEDERKLGFISPHLIPKRAICDPELTLGLPPSAVALHRDLPVATLQPARRGDRDRWLRAALERASHGVRRWRQSRSPLGGHDGRASGRADLPEGPWCGPRP